MGKLEGRVAIVSGGSSGLGFAEAKTMAREGAKVTIFARGEERLMRKKAELEALGYDVLALVADAGKQADWDIVVAETVKKYGKIDILMNNAGIMSNNYPPEQQCFIPGCFNAEAFLDGINQCFMAQLMGIYACWEELKKTHGCVVNTASVHAVGTMNPLSHYGCSKAAVRYMTKSLANQLAADGIRVNAIVPGFIHTELIPFAGDPEHPVTKIITHNTKLKKVGEPNDIANAVLYLVSDEAKYVTGIEILVDGGISIPNEYDQEQ